MSNYIEVAAKVGLCVVVPACFFFALIIAASLLSSKPRDTGMRELCRCECVKEIARDGKS